MFVVSWFCLVLCNHGSHHPPVTGSVKYFEASNLTPTPSLCVAIEPSRIAVVGSGIAGLSCAWLLSQQHDVTIFEREKKLGMDAHAVINPDGTHFDVPLRIFNPEYYPNLTKLYDTVGIKYQPVSFAFSCTYLLPGAGTTETLERDCAETGLSFFRYSNFKSIIKFPYPSLSLNPNQKWVPGWAQAVAKFGKLCYELIYFFLMSPGHLGTARMGNKSLGDYLRTEGYSQDFIGNLLYPMLTVVCTCSYKTLDNYPAEVIVAYYNSYGVWTWLPNPGRAKAFSSGEHCRVTDGVCDVVAKLSADCKNIKLNAKVARVSPGTGVGGKGGKVGWTDGVTGEAKEESFDAVVIATQAHHAKNLLTAGKGNPTTIDALGCWGHEASRVVVHTDPRLMPARESDWSNVNLILENENAKCFEGGVKNEKFKVDPRAWPSSSNLKEQCPGKLAASMCSIWMHPIDSSLDKKLIQTWNPIIEPDEDKVIVNSWFERPTLNSSTGCGIDALRDAQGDGGLFFVGAYSLYSMPLLENGVRSSCKVAKMLGAETVWGDVCYQGDRDVERRRQMRKEGKGDREGGGWGWTFLAVGAFVGGVVMLKRTANR